MVVVVVVMVFSAPQRPPGSLQLHLYHALRHKRESGWLLWSCCCSGGGGCGDGDGSECCQFSKLAPNPLNDHQAHDRCTSMQYGRIMSLGRRYGDLIIGVVVVVVLAVAIMVAM